MYIFKSRLLNLLNFVMTLTSIPCAADGVQEAQSIVVALGQFPVGFALRSKNDRYLLAMQNDCNLVLYDFAKSRLPSWVTNTFGQGANCYAIV
uniref:Uncharacterized protein n=1 Tax=Physcomitrium patens TaxID=3218 RepID=A0A2K1KXK7_PHYPA|nr:hypothetical protein PHYPA_005520 [Physcomitrium patens]